MAKIGMVAGVTRNPVTNQVSVQYGGPGKRIRSCTLL
jgi:hypothetical protein